MDPSSEREAWRREKMLDILPPELWTDVFQRLPVRTLLSLKCVRKSFFSLIGNPSFARRHFDLFNNHFHGEDGTRLLVVERPVQKGMLRGAQFVTRCGHQLIETAKFAMPVDWGYTIEVMGCVDGLLFLHKLKSPLEKWESTEMILCNPLIGKSLVIPPSPESLELGPGSWADLGFGYDPASNDYKAVAAVHSEHGSIWLELYSLRRGSWKVTESDNLIGHDTVCISNRIYLDGVIYWACGFLDEKDQGASSHGIVSVHLATEDFWFVVFPPVEEETNPEKDRVKILVVLDGYVAAFIISPNHTWVFVLEVKDGSWSKAFEWDSKEEWFTFLEPRRVSNAVFFKESSELLVSLHGQGVVSYSYVTHEMTPHNHGATYMGTYVESLLWTELLPQSNPNAEATA